MSLSVSQCLPVSPGDHLAAVQDATVRAVPLSVAPRTGIRDELTLQDCFNEDIVLLHRESGLDPPPQGVLSLNHRRSSRNYPRWERLPGDLNLVGISAQGVCSLTGIIA